MSLPDEREDAPRHTRKEEDRRQSSVVSAVPPNRESRERRGLRNLFVQKKKVVQGGEIISPRKKKPLVVFLSSAKYFFFLPIFSLWSCIPFCCGAYGPMIVTLRDGKAEAERATDMGYQNTDHAGGRKFFFFFLPWAEGHCRWFL